MMPTRLKRFSLPMAWTRRRVGSSMILLGRTVIATIARIGRLGQLFVEAVGFFVARAPHLFVMRCAWWTIDVASVNVLHRLKHATYRSQARA